MTHLTNQKVILTVSEAAQYLGLAQSTLNKWRCFGDGPRFLKLGKAIRYRKSDLDKFLDEHRVESTSQYGDLL